MGKAHLFSVFFLFLVFLGHGHAKEKAIIVGGGITPEKAYEKFVDWSGKDSRLLMVGWSTIDPVGGFESFKKRLKPYLKNFRKVELSPTLSEMKSRTALSQFKKQLNRASGVYLSGGYQNYFMDVISLYPELKTLFLKKYKDGTVIMGTSAGAAIFSDPMIVSDLENPTDYWVERGMGFLPGFLVDQHFIARSRETRLTDLMAREKIKMGLGVDNDSAAIIQDDRYLLVAGGESEKAAPVSLYSQVDTELKKKLCWDGETYDLTDSSIF